jgi:hypothetical protein
VHDAYHFLPVYEIEPPSHNQFPPFLLTTPKSPLLGFAILPIFLAIAQPAEDLELCLDISVNSYIGSW